MFIQRSEMGNIINKHYNFGDQSLQIAVGGGGGRNLEDFWGSHGFQGDRRGGISCLRQSIMDRRQDHTKLTRLLPPAGDL